MPERERQANDGCSRIDSWLALRFFVQDCPDELNGVHRPSAYSRSMFPATGIICRTDGHSVAAPLSTTRGTPCGLVRDSGMEGELPGSWRSVARWQIQALAISAGGGGSASCTTGANDLATQRRFTHNFMVTGECAAHDRLPRIRESVNSERPAGPQVAREPVRHAPKRESNVSLPALSTHSWPLQARWAAVIRRDWPVRARSRIT